MIRLDDDKSQIRNIYFTDRQSLQMLRERAGERASEPDRESERKGKREREIRRARARESERGRESYREKDHYTLDSEAWQNRLLHSCH